MDQRVMTKDSDLIKNFMVKAENMKTASEYVKKPPGEVFENL